MPEPVLKVAAAAPVAKTIEVHQMQAVHGLLIHPYTHTRFVTSKSLPHEMDDWCQGQIDAGKLKIV